MEYERVCIVHEWLDLKPSLVMRGQVWRLLTYSFCHDRMGVFHILFNMLFLFWFGMTLQFAGCGLLLTGWHADIGVLFLIVFTVVANAIFHRYWIVADPVRRNITRIMLLNGIAILGGLLLLLQNVR